MHKIVLKYNRGFQWHSDTKICFKGFFFDSHNNYHTKDSANSYFDDVKNRADFLKKINSISGLFTVIFKNSNETYIACDTTRAFPLFYTWDKNILWLTDDINFLKKKINPTINQQYTYEFKRLGFTLGNTTLLEGIFQLQASEFLIFDNNKIVDSGISYSHTTKDYSKKSSNSLKKEIKIQLDATFENLIKSLNNKPVVIPLSGGFDSRLIAYYFKKFNYKNVVTYTYGKVNNADMLRSKEVTEKLGFQWNFIEYKDDLIEGYSKTEIFKEYCKENFHYSTMLFLQEYFAVKYLKENNLIPNNAVFIPGHDGGALGGGYFLKMIPQKLTKKNIINQIAKNYTYSEKEKHAELKNHIRKILKKSYFDFTPHSVYEDFLFKEVTPKVIINSSSVYDFFGYEYRMPFWDKNLLTCFKTIPLEQKFNKKIYVEILKSLFAEYDINYNSEMHPSIFNLKKLKAKNTLKNITPNKLITNRLKKNDWLNAKKITEELEECLKDNQLPYNQNYKSFNEINIQWYLYYCQNLIKKC